MQTYEIKKHEIVQDERGEWKGGLTPKNMYIDPTFDEGEITYWVGRLKMLGTPFFTTKLWNRHGKYVGVAIYASVKHLANPTTRYRYVEQRTDGGGEESTDWFGISFTPNANGYSNLKAGFHY